MPTYRLTWSIDWDAETPEQAAQEVMLLLRDPLSIATIFHIDESATGKTNLLDAENPANPFWIQ